MDGSNQRTTRISVFIAGAVVATAMLWGCTRTGTGTGVASAPGIDDQRVVFYWKSGPSALYGHINTALPTGEQFRGTFLELTSTTTVDDAWPFYNAWYADGWGPQWDTYWWDGAYAPGVVSYMTNYSGTVLATLSSPRGTTMRCRFYLNEPESGLAAGGQGECRTSDGAIIDSVILAPSH